MHILILHNSDYIIAALVVALMCVLTYACGVEAGKRKQSRTRPIENNV